MWKKFLFFLCLSLIFIGSAQIAFADTCFCGFTVTSNDGCILNEQRNLELDEFDQTADNLTLSSVLEPLAAQCPGGNRPRFEYDEPLNINPANCAGLRRDGSSAGNTFQFNFACRIQPAEQQVQGSENSVGPSNKTDGKVRLVNPIGGTEENPQGTFDMRIIMGRAVQVVLGFLGSITLGVIFYGGFLWLTSAGNSDKVSKGSKTMLYAVIGLFIIFGSYGILNTIIQGVRSGAIDSNSTPLGPETDPNAIQQPCSTFNVTDCNSQGNRCFWFGFQFPDDSQIEQCIEKNTLEDECLRMEDECVNRFGQILADNCERELYQCINQ